MLSIQNVSKRYTTGTLVQTALDGVSLNLRDSEFVAVLGPSGSGKTTLLNVIGGLDRYDSGDLVINGISTKKYRDRDWDSYRNHAIGFVFQSYNLIPHQTVLANVELALTISGISKAERRRRATAALEEVGLGDQLHKKPAQMSGGQMQRVAIARALVNDPEILLADEPTGALDTETGVQVMELLKRVAEKRLVVMVTHNPELAESYATRIVKLRDGKITDDSNPFEIPENIPARHENMGKSSMSFMTALALSFNNLRTKKARTLLTAFAGSIGIIGIALILSLSTGVNDYISSVQKDTMTSYPIQVDAQTLDLMGVMQNTNLYNISSELTHDTGAVYSNPAGFHMASGFTTSFTENNLTGFKEYLDNPDSEIHEYIGENGIVYSYSTSFDVYSHDPSGELLNTDGSTLNPQYSAMNSMMPESASMMMGNISNFQRMIPGKSSLISPAITDAYELLHGEWPNAYDEAVLVLNKNYEVDANVLYQLGFLPAEEYRTTMQKITAGEDIELVPVKFSYEEVLEKEFMLVPACDVYKENENGTFSKIEETSADFTEVLDNSLRLRIVGVIKPYEDTDSFYLTSAIAYTEALEDYVIEHTDNSAVVQTQLLNPEINVLNNLIFSPSDDQTKLEDAKIYFETCGVSEKAKIFKEMSAAFMSSDPEAASMYAQMGEVESAAAFDNYLLTAEPSALLYLYDTYISSGTYEDNLNAFGVVSKDAPSSISIYADSFEDKDMIGECIEAYNKTVSENDEIAYTDYVGLLMSSVTTIIDVISYVLIAFVSVSLVVSSIMIGIITYISVLERTKEIGILRAIGASKKNVSQVFNAETFIVGLCSGVIGIGFTLLLILPINAIIHALSGISTINAILPWKGAIFLVVLSMILTVISGLIPSRKAAKKDPVAALRSE
ncbi:MAG: ABC transporter ATP-binding protein/permease [Clostridia bacterium]|nr:ABC transporter ATP-binding protein/permease [Clostridia bacterium]